MKLTNFSKKQDEEMNISLLRGQTSIYDCRSLQKQGIYPVIIYLDLNDTIDYRLLSYYLPITSQDNTVLYKFNMSLLLDLPKQLPKMKLISIIDFSLQGKNRYREIKEIQKINNDSHIIVYNDNSFEDLEAIPNKVIEEKRTYSYKKK